MSPTQVPPGFGDEPRISLSTDLTPWLLEVEATRRMRPRNGYTCDACGRSWVTIDRHPGVTPMLMACYATDGCAGEGSSMFYPAATPSPTDVPVMEWYRPSRTEYATLSAEMRDHVDRGGLAHRDHQP